MAKKPAEVVNSDKREPTKISQDQISIGVPDVVKVAIAGALMEFANMEAALEVLIWEITGLSFDDGRLLTKQDISAKIKLTKRLSEKYQIAAPKVKRGMPTMWRAMEDLLQPRNQIAHGMWVMIDLKIPAAASYRIPSEPDQMAADAFPIHRLEAIARQSKEIRECLDWMIDAAHTWRAKLAAPHRKNSPIPKPLPTPPQK